MSNALLYRYCPGCQAEVPVERRFPKALLFLLTILYIACIDWAGFTITTFAFLALGMLLLSGRERKNTVFVVVLSAALAFGGYLLFVVAFERHFPEGPFEHAFKAMMNAVGGS